MHPITVIEITATAVFISALFIIALIVPKSKRRIGLYTASFITICILGFFLIRPHWIHYQVSIKKEQLNTYLEQKYPGEKWKITRNIGRQYNPYHLLVEFENEKGWVYYYFVKDANNIQQKGYGMPDGAGKVEGKHFQQKDW
ncbi:hypothetical protein [Fictibacillus barbaricus]|uniref:DUF3139 domain-containing protein n=1 Tax=Fictibacillus barbaricus TaxID=182136 RepID=A0ABS2ZC87_9BACL|nr:hypothetical protein [Fictibacillus barbaricus]MBN3544355.1 hypothetical protein [Fictibacillus barbaricus]GGB67506.1 hypothetical protein GCM10007199_37080 [Fictibacillus barbaricus]